MIIKTSIALVDGTLYPVELTGDFIDRPFDLPALVEVTADEPIFPVFPTKLHNGGFTKTRWEFSNLVSISELTFERVPA